MRQIPSKEQVLEAAERCPQTKEALKILFPDDFEAELWCKVGTVLQSNHGAKVMLVRLSPYELNMIDLADRNRWFLSWKEGPRRGETYCLPLDHIEQEKYNWKPICGTIRIERHK